MIYNLRALAVAKPTQVFVATHIKNAFGVVLRQKALEALRKHAPQVAPIVALFWKPNSTLLIPLSKTHNEQIQVPQDLSRRVSLHSRLLHLP